MLRSVLLSLGIMVSGFCGGGSRAATQPVPAVATALPAVTPTPAASPVDSVALLYVETDNGGLVVNCTATAFDGDVGFTMFLTAAHCVTDDTNTKLKNVKFFLSTDELGVDRVFLPATVQIVGDPKIGDDFAVVTVAKAFPYVPLGTEAPHRACTGSMDPSCRFLNIAAPRGLGKFSLLGTISSMYLDRSTGSKGWRGYMVVEVHGAPGSSGSALICEEHRHIIGLLIGFDEGYVVAMPISRLRKMDPTKLIYIAGVTRGK